MHLEASDVKIICVKEEYDDGCHEGFKQYDLMIKGKSVCHAFTDSFHNGSGKSEDGKKEYDQVETISEKRMIEYAKKIVYLMEKKRLSQDSEVRKECDAKINKFSEPIIATIIKNKKIDYSNTSPSLSIINGKIHKSY